MKKIAIVLVLAVGVGAWATRDAWLGGGAADIVEYEDVGTGPLRMTVQTTGPLKPIKTVPIGSEVSGTLDRMLVNYNEKVTKGQTLATLRTELFESRVAQAQASYDNAVASRDKAELLLESYRELLPNKTAQARLGLDIAQETHNIAEFAWKRTDELFNQNESPELEWQNARTNYLTAKQQHEQAKLTLAEAKLNEKTQVAQAEADVRILTASMAQAKATLELAQRELNRCEITAPIDGIVLQKLVDEGEQVVSAFTAQPVLVITPDLSQMQVHANVSESDIGMVRVGQSAEFTVDSCGDRPFAGIVQQVRNNPVTIQGVVTYQVLINVDNSEALLRPEMTANVAIEVVHRDQTAKISNSALRFRPDMDPRERERRLSALDWPERPVMPALSADDTNAAAPPAQSVMWVYEDGNLKPVPVWVGITDNEETEILSGAEPGGKFVSRFVRRATGAIGSFQEALKQANPGNRSL